VARPEELNSLVGFATNNHLEPDDDDHGRVCATTRTTTAVTPVKGIQIHHNPSSVWVFWIGSLGGIGSGRLSLNAQVILDAKSSIA
jgi:hypothetical protein